MLEKQEQPLATQTRRRMSAFGGANEENGRSSSPQLRSGHIARGAVPGKNSEDHEIIFQRWLDRVIERMWRTEIRTGRVHSGMPNNPVGFVEDF
jgi:hypothetical protein